MQGERRLDGRTVDALVRLQKGEDAGYRVYRRLARREKDAHNRRILEDIADQERAHYELFARHSGRRPRASLLYVLAMLALSRLFGLTFGLKLLERVEAAREPYEALIADIPGMERVVKEEEAHEARLLEMISEEKLGYMGSVVLGLNDALVELTGALAGFTLSIQNARTIALLGMITGISASFSMAASEYLSTRSDGEEGVRPGRAAFYTGLAYVLTVIVLVAPFFLFASYLSALGLTVVLAIGIIALFNYYLSVVRNEPFTGRFLEMAAISLGVATLSFVIGYVVRRYLGLDI